MPHEKSVLETDEVVDRVIAKVIEELKEKSSLQGERIRSLEKRQDDLHKTNLELRELTFSMIVSDINTVLQCLGDMNNVIETIKAEFREGKDQIMLKWSEGLRQEAFEDASMRSMKAVRVLESIQTQIPTMLDSTKRIIEKMKVKEAYT